MQASSWRWPDTLVKTYIGDRELQRGIEDMARRGYAVQSHTTVLGGRGATKLLIGYLAAQKVHHTIVFAKMQVPSSQYLLPSPPMYDVEARIVSPPYAKPRPQELASGIPAALPPNDGSYDPSWWEGRSMAGKVSLIVAGSIVALVILVAIFSPHAANATPTQAAVVSLAASVSTAAATPIPAADATPTATSVVTASPTPTLSATSTPIPAQVVTIKEDAVNLRAAADVAAAVVTLVPPGTDATVIGEDTTGPDGVTRYVHARVGSNEGYLRSDLVSAPHVVTPAPPTATAGPAEAAATITARSNATDTALAQLPSNTPMAPTATRDPNAQTRVVSGTLAFSVYAKYYDPAPTEAGSAFGARPGYRIVAFDIAVENLGNTSQDYNLFYTYLKTSDSRKYDAAFTASTLIPVFGSGTNGPHEITRGWISFEIPENASIAILGYQDVFGHSASIRFNP